MIETSVRPEHAARTPEARSLVARPALVLLLIGALLFAMVGGALVLASAVVAAAPPSTTLGLADGAADVPLDGKVPVEIAGWDARLNRAALFETPLGPDGVPGAERPIPVQASLVRESRWPEGVAYTIQPVGAGLSPDASYRLVVETSALVPAVPLPTRASYEREVRFRTLRSPTPQPLAGPVQLKWGQPLQIVWDAPLDDVRYVVSPPTPIRTAIDPANRRLTTVVLEDPVDAQTYRIAVAEARGANGIAASRQAEYVVTAPARPKLLDAEEPRTIELGKPLDLKWSVPIDRLKLEIEPPATTSWQVDRRDPTVVQVKLDGLVQGATYTLTVAEAYSRDGAPLAEAPSLTLETPERLMVDELDTGTESARVSTKAKPILSFTQPIRNPREAVAAFSIEPAIPGRWEWLDDRRVQFTPLGTLPFDAEVTIKVRPGLDGARSVAGAYFENQAVLSFVTESDKLIDVDVTRQVMTLYEQGRAVRTFKVATGVPGADTPLGEFNVEYKMPIARFQGVNVNGSRYDIPDVRWVLAFMGDYTIHGAYWRSGFGAPGSNGCVSLTDDDAKAVFDWAPEGTRIRIHY